MLARLIFILGGAALIGSALFLYIMTDGVENEWAMAILGRGLCASNEQISEELGAYSYDSATDTSGQTSTYYCTNLERSKRDVSIGALGIIVGGFIGLILLGMTLFTIGLRINVRQDFRSTV